MRRIGLAVALAALSLLATSFAVAAPGDRRPPDMVLSNHGDQGRSKPFTYCWSQPSGASVCADGFPGKPVRPRIRFHPGDIIKLRTAYPAKSIVVDGLARRVRVRSSTSRLTQWRFRIPGKTKQSTTVSIFANFDRGDGAYAFRAVLHPGA